MESPVAPETEAMKRGQDEPARVTVQALTAELLDAHAVAITRAYSDGAGAKYCCLCCSLAEDHSGKGLIKFMGDNPSRLPSWGIAIDTDGQTLGYVAMTLHPMQPMDGLHTTMPGEAYIDQVMATSAARGKGVCTELLEWAESQAREQKCTVLALEVLNGNPGKKLYERFGFEVKPAGVCTRLCISPIFICCFASLPYGCPHWGSVLMTKSLA